MAREVIVSAPGAAEMKAKVRNPWGVLGLMLITFGIYGWFWWYFVNREMANLGKSRGTTDLGEKPWLSVLAITLGAFLIVPAIWTYVATARRIQRAQKLAGVESFNGWFFAFLLVVTLGLAGYPYMQNQLNKVWAAPGLVGAQPEAASAPAAEPHTAAHHGTVEFDAEGKVTRVDLPVGEWTLEQRGQTRYYTQQGTSLLHATELLKAVASVPELTYYTVETPDGALSRDMFGFYTEGPIKTSRLRLVTSAPVHDTVESISLTAYGDEPMKSQTSVAQLKQQGHYANFILLIECGRCGYKSPVETQAGAMERECYCCGATNKTSRGAINVYLGSTMVEI